MTPIQEIAERHKKARLFTDIVDQQLQEGGGTCTTAAPPVSEWDYVRDVGLLMDFVRAFDKFCWENDEMVDWPSQPEKGS